jgi:restriction endonuclease
MNTNDEQDRIKELEHIIRTMNQEMTYIQSINDTYEELISNAQEVLLEARNELAKKENDYDDINTELCEEKRILSFIEEQTNEMRNMINNASNNKKGKLTIEELI